MTGAYEELAGEGTPVPPPAPAPKPKRHEWKPLHQSFRTVKHFCPRCSTTRVRTTHEDRFPTTRYTTLAGVVSEKAPPCQ